MLPSNSGSNHHHSVADLHFYYSFWGMARQTYSWTDNTKLTPGYEYRTLGHLMPTEFSGMASGGAAAQMRRYGKIEMLRRGRRRNCGGNAGGDNAQGFGGTNIINEDDLGGDNVVAALPTLKYMARMVAASKTKTKTKTKMTATRPQQLAASATGVPGTNKKMHGKEDDGKEDKEDNEGNSGATASTFRRESPLMN